MKRSGFLYKNAPVILTVFVCIIVVSTIYSNSLNAEFVFDDRHSILQNSSVRMDTINLESILTSIKSNRPIPMFSFALNYYLGGYCVQGYHIVNIVIHIINSVLVFFLCSKLLIIAGYKDGWERRWLPVLTACLWAVNPVHVQSVTYIVQRMNSMATMFYIASFICYLTARTTIKKRTKKTFFILSVLAGILSILSKEMAVTLPFFILLFEWIFFRDANTKLFKKYILYSTVFSLLVGIIGFILLQPVYSNFIATGYSNYNFDMIQRCLTEFRVVIYYIGLLFFPHPSRLNIDYDFTVSNSIIDPFSTFVAIIIVVTSIIFAFYIILHKPLKSNGPGIQTTNRLIAFCILWYLGNLFIESSFIPLDMVFEHRTYLPSILLFLMLIVLLVNGLKNRGAFVIAILICIVVSSSWTHTRNKDWRTELSLWLDTSVKSPEKGRPYLNVGRCYETKKDFETSYKYYVKAMERNSTLPTRQKAAINIGVYYSRLGKYDTALNYYKKALELIPGEIEATVGMGTFLLKTGKFKLALELFEHALTMNPDHLQAQINSSAVYMALNKPEKALKHNGIALKLSPDNANLYYSRGILFIEMDKTDLAIEALKKSIILNNKNALPHVLLGKIYSSTGNYDTGILHFEQAVKISPDSVDCHEEWANLLLKKGDTENAAYHFNKIIEIDPKNTNAYINIGVLLFNNDDIFGGLVNLKKALHIEPENKKVNQYYTIINKNWVQLPILEKIDIVDSYITNNKKDALAVAELGKLHYANKDYLKSLSNWELFLKLKPENFMAMNNIAVCQMLGKNFAYAAEMYNKMIEIQPDNQIIFYNLACVYSASGEFKQSVKALKNAISKGFSDIEDMKKDPDLSRVMRSNTGKNFLRTLDSKS